MVVVVSFICRLLFGYRFSRGGIFLPRIGAVCLAQNAHVVGGYATVRLPSRLGCAFAALLCRDRLLANFHPALASFNANSRLSEYMGISNDIGSMYSVAF